MASARSIRVGIVDVGLEMRKEAEILAFSALPLAKIRLV